MLNHLPVIGAPVLLLLLTLGLLRRSGELTLVALGLIVGLAAATALVYLTGEPAEELVERAPWFRELLTETREEQATVSLVAALATGVLAAAALALRNRAWGGRWLPRAVWGGLAATTLLSRGLPGPAGRSATTRCARPPPHPGLPASTSHERTASSVPLDPAVSEEALHARSPRARGRAAPAALPRPPRTPRPSPAAAPPGPARDGGRTPARLRPRGRRRRSWAG